MYLPDEVYSKIEARVGIEPLSIDFESSFDGIEHASISIGLNPLPPFYRPALDLSLDMAEVQRIAKSFGAMVSFCARCPRSVNVPSTPITKRLQPVQPPRSRRSPLPPKPSPSPPFSIRTTARSPQHVAQIPSVESADYRGFKRRILLHLDLQDVIIPALQSDHVGRCAGGDGDAFFVVNRCFSPLGFGCGVVAFTV